MLFGNQQYQDLPEEVIEVIVSSGIGDAQAEQITRIMRQREAHSGRMYYKLRNLGLSAAIVSGLVKAWYHSNENRTEGLGKRKSEGEGNPRGNKYQANQYNFKKPGEVQMIEAEKVGEKRPAPPVIDKAPTPPKVPAIEAPKKTTPNDWTQWTTDGHSLQDRDHEWLYGNDNEVWEEEDIDDEFGHMDDDMDDILPDDPGTPDLGDLIPESAGSRTSGRDDMDESMEPVPEAAEARQANPVGAGNVSKETPVTAAQPSYGLQETHTTILPFNCFFSVVNPATDYSSAATTYQTFRMTSPLNCIVNSLTAVAEGAAWPVAPGAIVNVPFNNAANRSGAGLAAVFPYTTPSGSSATEKAWWFAYWAKIYEYYTVLNCEYEIVVTNPTTTNSQGMVIGMDFDAYSDTAGATGNITPKVASLMEMRSFKNIKWRRVGPNSSETNQYPNTVVIRGNYKPGMAHRNVSNDGDVKTWNKIDAQPTLKEFLNLYFYRDPLIYPIGDPATKLLFFIQNRFNSQ